MNAQKYTQKSLEAVQNAQSIATEYGNQQIEQPHLLLALLLDEGGLIPQLLGNMGLTVPSFTAAAKAEVEKLPRVSGSGREQGKIYVAQDVDKCLNTAESIAASMKDEYVSVEHLLLALLDTANRELKELFRTYNVQKEGVLQALTNVRGNQRVTSDNPEETYNALKKYGSDLVERARANKLDPVIGRDDEIRNVIRILSRKSKNNPVLIGEPGVGKTAIAEGLAQRIVKGDVPASLKDKTIFALDMGVRGAALATVIAQGCSAVWVLKFLTGRKAILRLRLRNLALGAGRVKSIVALGLSGFFMNLTNSLVQVVCNATLQAYGGDLYVGVMTIINSLREVFFMPVQGLTNGAQPVTGYNYGAGRYSRVRSSIRFSVAVTVGYAAVFWAAAMLFPGLLIRVFNSEPEVVAAGIPALRIYFCLFIPMSLQMAGQGVFVSLGRSKQAVFFSLLRKAIINAPLTVVLPIWMGTTGVFTAEAISQLVGGLACSLTMYFTVYRPLGRLPDRPPENI